MFYRDLKTLFVHIPKTAGMSVYRILGKNSTCSDLVDSVRQENDSVVAGKIYHRKAIEYLTKNNINEDLCLLQKDYDEYFKFAVVREPLDRASSIHRYLVRSNRIDKSMPASKFFLNWLPKTLENESAYLNYFVLPQFDFVSYKENICIDKILYFENLENGLNQVCDILNIKNKKIKENETQKSDYPDISKNKNIVKMIEKLYEKDYRFFYN